LTEVRPWGELTVEYSIEGEGRKSDFVGLYNEAGRECGEPFLRPAAVHERLFVGWT